jgi:hypothetical protein
MLECRHQDYQTVAEEASEYIESGDLLAARDLLLSFVEAGNPEGFIYLSIGEISRAIGNSEEILKSIGYFHLAIKFANEANDSQVVLAAKTSLGITYLQEAFKEYKNLPENTNGKEVMGQIDFLDRKIEFDFSNLNFKENLKFFAYTSPQRNCNIDNQNEVPPLDGRWVGAGAGRVCIF